MHTKSALSNLVTLHQKQILLCQVLRNKHFWHITNGTKQDFGEPYYIRYNSSHMNMKLQGTISSDVKFELTFNKLCTISLQFLIRSN